MKLAKGIREIIEGGLYHVKGVILYMKYFKGYLHKVCAHDESVRMLTDQISEKSSQLAEDLDQLLQKINILSPKQQTDFDTNQRKTDRIMVEGEATLIIKGSVQYKYMLKDFSPKGIGIIGNYPIQKENNIDVIVTNPFLKNTVHKQAKIVWGRKIDDDLWEGGIAFHKSESDAASQKEG